jgi:hypothetical protein
MGDEPEDELLGIGRDARRELLRAGGREVVPLRCKLRADHREGFHPGRGRRHAQRRQRFRPVRDLCGVLHDGHDAERERHHQQQQQQHRHQRHGEGAPAAEPRLRLQQERPGGDDDHGGPGQRDQEWTHDPEARGDQYAEGEQLEGAPGKV